MAKTAVSLVTPIGRFVAGNLYKGNDKNFDGKPRLTKDGKPSIQFFFALAIPKGAERGWWETPWGSQILAVGQRAFPQASQRPDFAWKVDDGDSTIPNKRNRRPCDQEGHKGHWILKFTSGFAVPIYMQDGGKFVQNLQEGFVKPGYFADVAFNVVENDGQTPGVYLNPTMFCFRYYGEEIAFGPDANEVFAAAPATLPAGALLTPAQPTLPMPAISPAPGAAAAPVPVTPNPGFLQMPPPGGFPTPPAAGVGASLPANTVPPPPMPASASPSSGPRYQMTAAAQASREVYLAANWTDAQLIAQGLMVQV